MTDLLPYALPLAAGLLGLLFTPAVDRWAERFDAWAERGRPVARKNITPQ